MEKGLGVLQKATAMYVGGADPGSHAAVAGAHVEPAHAGMTKGRSSLTNCDVPAALCHVHMASQVAPHKSPIVFSLLSSSPGTKRKTTSGGGIVVGTSLI